MRRVAPWICLRDEWHRRYGQALSPMGGHIVCIHMGGLRVEWHQTRT